MSLLDDVRLSASSKHSSLFVRFFVLVALVTFTCPAFCQAPTDMNLDTGIRPNETYDGGRETISVASGNLNLQIPLVHLPGRNGHDLDITLAYNSQNWVPTAYLEYAVSEQNWTPIYMGWSAVQSTMALGTTGWQINVPVLYASGLTTFSNGSAGPPPYGGDFQATSCWTNFVVSMGDGTKYSFPAGSLLCQQQSTICGSSGTSTNCTTTNERFPYADALLAPDWGSDQGTGAGIGAILDMRNFASGLAIVRFRDGSQIQFPLSNVWQATPTGGISSVANALVDTNGNITSITQSRAGLTFTDSVGRSVLWAPGNEASIPDTIQYHDSSGTMRSVTLNYTQFAQSNPAPTFTNPAVGTAGVVGVNVTPITGPMLSSIVLPNGLSYTFQYNQYGELIKQTYPSGGYTRYQYAAFPHSDYEWTTADFGTADRREVTEKDVCPAVVTPAGATSPSGYVGAEAANNCTVAENTTTYNRNSPIASPIIVTDPLGNQTSYTFGQDLLAPGPPGNAPPGLINVGLNDTPLETSRVMYQGSSTVLQTINTAYQNSALPTSTTTILPNGLQSQIQRTYDFSLYQSPITIVDGPDTFTGNASSETDNVLTESEYGFGPNAPGPLVRKTVNTYLATNPISKASYQSDDVYILNRKLSATIYNGSNTQVAQTNYEYDNYQGGISASGAVQHGTPINSFPSSYIMRGNLTATSSWVNTTGNSLVTRNYAFDDAGNVLVSQDPKGNQTTYSYGDAWASTTCKPASGNAAAYVTSVTNPLSQKTTYTWNSCSGTMASTVDPNQQQTTLAYDLMDRRVAVNLPDTGQTCLQYSDAPNSACPAASSSVLPITITTSKKINSSTSSLSSTTLDGESRPVLSQVLSDPSGTDYVVTSYDAAGNVASVTNPYRSTSDPTYGTTQDQYDALHRKIIETEADGKPVQWCYDGVAVTSAQTICSANLGSPNIVGTSVDFADEMGNHWQRTSDAQGRLTKVMEPNGATQSPSMETDYTYDTLDNLSTVAQWGGSNGSVGARTRSFVFDSVSRLTTAQNAETGTVTYNYLLGSAFCAGNMSLPCSKTDARGVTTSYSYDFLNRLLGKTYSNDATGSPASCYHYDTSLGSGGSNLVGRLTAEWTQKVATGSMCPSAPSTAITSRLINAYDPVGRTQSESQCVQSICSTDYPGSSTFTYDLAGNLITYGNLMGTALYTNSYNSANQLCLISTTNENNCAAGVTPSAANLFSNPTYAPHGALSTATYGSSLALSRTYDPKLRITSEVDTGTGGSTVAVPGSATVTITGGLQIK